MLNLNRYIMLFEGGQAGHMAHPFDYTDFTGEDLIDIVDSLFNGKVENVKEKLDGFNILATMNDNGETVFIRNASNLNSEKGGMTVADMIEKWADKEQQRKVFSQSGETITKIFNKLGKEFFNPGDGKRKVLNCECIIAGKTNNLPYASDRVAFHGYKIYQKQGEKYVELEDVEGHVDDVYKAAEGIDAAKPRQNLIIKSAEKAKEYAEKFKGEITSLFASEHLKTNVSIESWKIARFMRLKPEWLPVDGNFQKIFDRWFNQDKSYSAVQMKKDYPDICADLKDEKVAKEYVAKVMEPLDALFLSIGNEFIDVLSGFTNDADKDNIVMQLTKDMEETVDLIRKYGSTKSQEKVEINLRRLQALGNKVNPAEGVVFMYKGRRMKLTGGFAPLNQILGTRYEIK